MTAVLPDLSVVIPVPRRAGEPLRRPRREHPSSEYWDVLEARWARR